MSYIFIYRKLSHDYTRPDYKTSNTLNSTRSIGQCDSQFDIRNLKNNLVSSSPSNHLYNQPSFIGSIDAKFQPDVGAPNPLHETSGLVTPPTTPESSRHDSNLQHQRHRRKNHQHNHHYRHQEQRKSHHDKDTLSYNYSKDSPLHNNETTRSTNSPQSHLIAAKEADNQYNYSAPHPPPHPSFQSTRRSFTTPSTLSSSSLKSTGSPTSTQTLRHLQFQSLKTQWRLSGGVVDSRCEYLLDAIITDLFQYRYPLPERFSAQFSLPKKTLVGSGANGRLFEAICLYRHGFCDDRSDNGRNSKFDGDIHERDQNGEKVAVKITLTMTGALHEVAM